MSKVIFSEMEQIVSAFFDGALEGDRIEFKGLEFSMTLNGKRKRLTVGPIVAQVEKGD